jgi:putative addiction module component (TIGR02574 family)
VGSEQKGSSPTVTEGRILYFEDDMIESVEIQKMSIAERLQTIEQIWDSLYRQAESIPSPDWHGEVLADRKVRAERGDAKFLTLDQLRSRFRNSQQ